MATPPHNIQEWMKKVDRDIAQVRRSSQASLVGYVNNKVGEVQDQVNAIDIDTRIPSAPVEIVVETFNQETFNNNVRQGYLTATFPAVTKATDGTDIQVGSYEMWMRIAGDPNASYTLAATSLDPVLTSDALEYGQTYEVIIRALTVTKRSGNFSEIQSVTITGEDPPPPMPATLIGTQRLGTVHLEWNGLSFADTAMPVDLSHTEVGMRKGAEVDYTPIGERFNEAGYVYYSNAPFSEQVTFSHRAYDYAGGVSEWAQGTPITVEPVVDTTNLEQRLTDAETLLDTTAASLTQTKVELDGRLDQAETDLTANAEAIGTLETVTIPALDTRLDNAQAEIDTNQTELTTRLDTAFVDIGELDASALANAQAASDAQVAADAARTYAESQLALVIAQGQNLVINGDFEAGNEGWAVGSTSSVTEVNPRSGTKALNISGATANVWPKSVSSPTSTGRIYYAEYWIRQGGSTLDQTAEAGIVFQIKTAAGGFATPIAGRVTMSSVPDFAYTKVSSTYTVTTQDAVSITFSPWVSGPTTNSYSIDDFIAVDVTEAQVALNAASTAQARADSAHALAGTAKSTADSALTMAGSKNVVMYSTQPPSGTGSPGDTWRQVGATNDVIAEWRWTNGGTWLSQLITSDVISNLDVGKLTVGTAVISTAVIDKLWAEVITAKKIMSSQVLIGDGTNMVPWNLVSGEGLETVVQYGGPSGTPDPTWGGTDGVSPGTGHLILNASWVAPGIDQFTWRILYDPSEAIRGGVWSKSGFPVVPGEEYKASIYYKSGGNYPDGAPSMRIGLVWYSGEGTYLASSVSPQVALTWSWLKHEVSAVAPATAAYAHLYVRQDKQGNVRVDLPSLQKKSDGSLIVNGSISGDHLDVNSVAAKVATVMKLDVGSLVASSATIDSGVIDKLWADVISARKITAEMVAIGSGDNMMPDPRIGDHPLWSGDITFGSGDGRFGGDSILVGSGTGQVGTYYALYESQADHRILLEQGASYRVSVQVRGSATIPIDGVGFFMRTYTDANVASFTTPSSVGNLSSIPAGAWGVISGILTVPDNSEGLWGVPGFFTQTSYTSAARFSNPTVTRMNAGELVVDGAIVATHITASSSLSAKVGQFLTVTTSMLSANVVKAGNIDTGAITAAKIDVGALDGKLITGATMRTSSSSTRLQMDSTGIKSLVGGVSRLEISASDGSFSMMNSGGGEVKISTTASAVGDGAYITFQDTSVAASTRGKLELWNAADGNQGWMAHYRGTAMKSAILVEDDLACLGMISGNTFQRYIAADNTYIRMRNDGSDGSISGSSLVQLGTYVDMQSKRSSGGEQGAYQIDQQGHYFMTRPGGGGEVIQMSVSSNNFKVLPVYSSTAPYPANMYVNEYGWVYRATSASRYKLDAKNVDETVFDKLLNIEVKDWFDKPEAERLSAAMTPTMIDGSTPDEIDAEHEEVLPPVELRRIPGVIAEEVEAVGLGQFVNYDDAGEVQGVMYDRLGVALIPVVRRQRDRIIELETAQADILARLSALEMR